MRDTIVARLAEPQSADLDIVRRLWFPSSMWRNNGPKQVAWKSYTVLVDEFPDGHEFQHFVRRQPITKHAAPIQLQCDGFFYVNNPVATSRFGPIKRSISLFKQWFDRSRLVPVFNCDCSDT
jgi:hypothetical protein